MSEVCYFQEFLFVPVVEATHRSRLQPKIRICRISLNVAQKQLGELSDRTYEKYHSVYRPAMHAMSYSATVLRKTDPEKTGKR